MKAPFAASTRKRRPQAHRARCAAVAAAAVAALGACDRVFPYRTTMQRIDGGRADADAADGLRDAAPADAAPRDADGPAPADGRPVDTAGDDAPPAAGDAAPPAAGDAAPPAAGDAAPVDAGGDDATRDASGPLRTLRVFVTQGVHPPTFGGVAGGDAICQAAAASATLGGSWRAWLADATASPATRFSKDGRYERLDGAPVADSWTDLTDGALTNPIVVDERGKPVTASLLVWTGTSPNGTAGADTCEGWTSAASDKLGQRGQANMPGSNWANQGLSVCSLFSFRLYCFEQ